MNNCKVILVLFIVLFSLFAHLLAQTITQEEFLNQLKKVHPLFEKEKLSAEIEKEEQNSYLGAQDWHILSSATFSHEEPAIAFAGPEKTDAFALSGVAERVFWETGGRLGASFTSSTAKIDPTFGFSMPFYQNEIAVSYIQPLLKNRKGFLDKLQYNLKQFDIDFSEVQAIENMEDFLALSASKFLDWVYLTEQKKIIVERLRLSEEELDRTKRKREANLVDQADVMRAEDAVRIWKQNQVLVESQWKGLQAKLAVLSQDENIKNLSPEFKMYQVKQLSSLEEDILKLKNDSRLIKTLLVKLDQLELVRKSYQHILQPDLSLVAQLNTKKLETGFGRSLEMNKPDAVVGLYFSLPLGNRTAKSHIKKTELQISQLKKQVDEITLALTSELTNLNIQLNELKNVLVLNQEQIESAKERTKEELKLYNQGRGDLTFVILSQDNEENAKFIYAQNALTYHKLTIQYDALMDQLYK
jgi:outer membrane protein TolC